MIKTYYNIIFIFTFLWAVPLTAQETKEEVRETLTVVKSYNPEIEPTRKQALVPKKPNFEKKSSANLNYTIATFPVLDVYIPKFEAPYLQWISPIEDIHSTIIRLSAGNNSSFNFDLSHHQYISSKFNYSLQASYDYLKGSFADYVYGPINNNMFLGSTMEFSSKKGDGSLRLKYANQQFNYYGKPIVLGFDVTEKSVKQRFNRAGVVFGYNFNTGVVEDIHMNLNTISDLTMSNELSFKAATTLEFELAERILRIEGFLDYVSGSFENAPLSEIEDSKPAPYQFVEIDVMPQFEINRGNLNLMVGIDMDYVVKNNNAELEFGLYPAVDALYTLSKEVLLKGSLHGETHLNSYEKFTNLNPYLSPTLEIEPTHTLFDLELGLQANSGKFLSLDINTSISRVKNQPLMMLNYQNYFRNDSGPYLNENLSSFQIVYDQVDEANISGSLLIRPADQLSLRTGISYSKYRTLNEEEAWNLPNIQAFGSINAKLADRWMLSSQLNYIGARKDREVTVVQFVMPGAYPSLTRDLEAFVNFDATLHYQYSDQWSFELKAKNLTNNQYQMWYNYPDLGTTITLGAQYRFDL